MPTESARQDLRRAGIALRLRRDGRRWLQTLKADGVQHAGLAQRAEWELPVRRKVLELLAFPREEIRRTTGLDLARLAPRLAPVFETRFTRRSGLVQVDGKASAELAIVMASATAAFAAGLLVLAFVAHTLSVGLALLVCGAGWLTVLSTCNTGVQLSVPSWVRARALGVYITVWGGAMAGGAAFWGVVGERWGIHAAFAAAGIGMLVLLALTGRLKIQALHQPPDLSPHHLQPHSPGPINPDQGPILTVLEYRVPEARKAAFQEAMREVRRIRIRDGAVRWSLFQDLVPPDPGQLRFVESFLSSSWGEHLRQHHRATVEDRPLFRTAEGSRKSARCMAHKSRAPPPRPEPPSLLPTRPPNSFRACGYPGSPATASR